MEPILAVGITAAIATICAAMIPVLGALFGGKSRTIQVSMSQENWEEARKWMQQTLIEVHEAAGLLKAQGQIGDERMQRLWYALERIERALNAMLDRR